MEAAMQRRSLLIGVTALVVLVVIAAGWFFLRKPAFRSEVINPALQAAEINMIDDHGNTFRMSDQRGKVVLLYFGFVNCPDECPLTLAHIKLALESLGAEAQDVKVVLVSTDPVRDTPQAMSDYLNNFNPDFIGIPGNPDDLEKIYKDYGVVVLDGGETHSSYTYVIDRKGNLRLTFVPDSEPEDIAHDLNVVLAEN
jgi:protein SCO1/2